MRPMVAPSNLRVPHPPPPGTGAHPCLHLVMAFGAPAHPNSLGACPDDPLDAGPEWTPFDFTLSRFLHATGENSFLCARAGPPRAGGRHPARADRPWAGSRVRCRDAQGSPLRFMRQDQAHGV
jgi:hypothetical protein